MAASDGWSKCDASFLLIASTVIRSWCFCSSSRRIACGPTNAEARSKAGLFTLIDGWSTVSNNHRSWASRYALSGALIRSDWWRTRRAAFELFGLKWFHVFSESLFYLSQRLENGRDARLQFRIFVRKGCIITLAVQHCGYPSAALANLPWSNGTNHTRGSLPGD
jgi:hypothetical protein